MEVFNNTFYDNSKTMPASPGRPGTNGLTGANNLFITNNLFVAGPDTQANTRLYCGTTMASIAL